MDLIASIRALPNVRWHFDSLRRLPELTRENLEALYRLARIAQREGSKS